MDNVSIIIASHGNFANEALKSAEMIVGEQCKEKVKTLAMTLGVDLEQFKTLMKNTIDGFGKGKKVLILTDLLGGTPNNAAVFNLIENNNIQVISGFNLPILLEVFTNEHMKLEQLVEHLMTIGSASVINVNKLYKKEEE